MNKKYYKIQIIIIFLSFLFISGKPLAAEKGYVFSIVPQQSASKTVRIWGPVLRYVSNKTGHHLRLKIYKDIPTFEGSLHQGNSDFSYMNPYHYVVFHDTPGYEAFAKAKDKRIKGILVVKKDGPIQSVSQLEGAEIAFPSPAAFAASLLIRGWLDQQGVTFTPVYVRSHDSGYLNVSKGRFPASGGVIRTLKNMKTSVRDQLQILHTTPGYTPHAIAAHPRVPTEVVHAVQKAFLSMDQDETGRKLLKALKIKGWEEGRDNDWGDVRALDLKELQ